MNKEILTIFSGVGIIIAIFAAAILIGANMFCTHSQKMASLGYCEYQSTGTTGTVWKKCE